MTFAVASWLLTTLPYLNFVVYGFAVVFNIWHAIFRANSFESMKWLRAICAFMYMALYTAVIFGLPPESSALWARFLNPMAVLPLMILPNLIVPAARRSFSEWKSQKLNRKNWFRDLK